jgi:hypothetical protein
LDTPDATFLLVHDMVVEPLTQIRRLRRVFFQYRTTTENWRGPKTDYKKRHFDILSITLTFARQTVPDERWHFSLSQRSSDGLGFSHHGGWARHSGSRNYCTIAHFNWYVSVSVRPVYKVIYSPGFVKDIARICGTHPIHVAEELKNRGATLGAQDLPATPSSQEDER